MVAWVVARQLLHMRFVTQPRQFQHHPMVVAMLGQLEKFGVHPPCCAYHSAHTTDALCGCAMPHHGAASHCTYRGAHTYHPQRARGQWQECYGVSYPKGGGRTALLLLFTYICMCCRDVGSVSTVHQPITTSAPHGACVWCHDVASMSQCTYVVSWRCQCSKRRRNPAVPRLCSCFFQSWSWLDIYLAVCYALSRVRI